MGFAVLGCSGGEPVTSDSNAVAEQLAELRAMADLPAVTTEDLCPATGKGGMRCFAKQVTSMNGDPMAVSPAPIAGLTAQDIQAAYKLPSGGDGRLVGIVDAFDAPNAEADMATYRQMFGLPPCTTANGCFRKLNQDGKPGPYPPADPGWEGEIMVDLAMVSATCPGCKIMLVEARSVNGVDLGPCVAMAKQLGAVVVNNSYGGPESDPDSVASYSYYNQPGTLVVASSGDDGYLLTKNDQGVPLQEIAFPASSPFVMSVGGTTLRTAANARGWTETAWSGAGSGCSKTQNKPSWQKDPACTKRFVADVSAIANPATGVAYYDGGWKVVGGTSVSAPILSGIAGLFNITDPGWPYAHPNAFFDVTSGSNGSCGGTYQCTSVAGVDGPTGLGTPNGALWTVQPPPDGGASGSSTTGGAAGGGGTGSGAGGALPTGAGGAAGSGGRASGAGGQGGGAAGAGGIATTGGTGGGAATGAGGGAATSTSATTGAAGSATTGEATTGGAGGSATLAPKPSEESGCSCRVGGNGDGSSRPASVLISIAMGLALMRRRRSHRY
jgi:MYXO-CTERM domain-containing protein